MDIIVSGIVGVTMDKITVWIDGWIADFWFISSNVQIWIIFLQHNQWKLNNIFSGILKLHRFSEL